MLNVRQPLDRRRSSVSAAGAGSRPAMRSKFSVSYEALLAGEHPWQQQQQQQQQRSLQSSPQQHHERHGGFSSPPTSKASSSGKKPSAPRARFYADLLCLAVEPATLSQLVADVPAASLVDEDEASKGARIRDNVGSLWRECLKLWRDVPAGFSLGPGRASAAGEEAGGSDEVRRNNAVETLVHLSKPILAKQFPHASTSLDLISIFAGSIDEADEVFETLVACIDEGLRGELDDPSLSARQNRPASRIPSSPSNDLTSSLQRQQAHAQMMPPGLAEIFNHRLKATRLAVVWISHVSSTNLAAYFVRRDLFVAAGTSLSLVQSIVQNVQAAKKRGEDPLSDEDEDLLREVVRETTLLFGLLAGLGQGASSSSGIGARSGGGGFGGYDATGSASNSPYFRRLCDWVDSGSMALVRDVAAADLEASWKAYEQASSAPQTGPTAAGYAIGGLAEGVKRLGLSSASPANSEPSTLLSTVHLPPPVASTLLPIFLLTRANEAFVDVALRKGSSADTSEADTPSILAPQDQTFATALLSLGSYLATHASASNRSRSYARLSLLAQLGLLSTSPGIDALILSERQEEVAKVKLCSQRAGPRPIKSPSASSDNITTLKSLLERRATTTKDQSSDEEKGGARTRLVTNILDSICQFLRFNLRKRLDVPAYLIALQILNLVLEACSSSQQSRRRIRLEYVGWTDLWRTLTSVASFLAGRHAELKGVETGQLGQALISTLSLAVLESDRFLPSSHDVNLLLYEVVRSGDALRKLALVLSTAGTSSNGLSNSSGAASRGGQDTVPGWRLLEAVLISFDEKLAEWSEAKRSKSKGLLGGYLDFATSWSSSSPAVPSSNGAESPAGEASASGRSSPSSSTSAPSRPQQKQAMPDVNTVMHLIATLDMERLTTMYSAPPSSGPSPSGGAATPWASSASYGGQHRTNHARQVHNEWLERAEAQCLSEALRFAAEDMRAVVASSPASTNAAASP